MSFNWDSAGGSDFVGNLGPSTGMIFSKRQMSFRGKCLSRSEACGEDKIDVSKWLKTTRVALAHGLFRNGFQRQIFRKDLLGVGLLGVGSFGAVELVAHRHAEETFAMKSCLALTIF